MTAAAYGVSASCSVRVYDRLNGLIMPGALKKIEDEAFSGNNAFQYAVIPDQVNAVGSSAFAGSSALLFVMIPPEVTEIGEHAFDETVTVYGESGSTAEEYCRANGIHFEPVR